jgi:O-antigen/teichoic acid export membrane protein
VSPIASPKTARPPRPPRRSRIVLRPPHWINAPQGNPRLPRLSLQANFSWTALGNVVNAACSWGRIVLLAHLGGADVIGQLVLAFAVCNPIDTLADLGLGGVLQSDATDEYRFGDYLGLRLVTAALGLTAICLTAWLGGYEIHTTVVILLAGLTVVLESVSDIFHAFLQRQERMDFAAISLMIRSLLGILLLAGGFAWTGDVAWGVVGLLAAAVVSLLVFDVPFSARIMTARNIVARRNGEHSRAPIGIGPLWNAPVLLRLAWLSLPLGVAAAGMALSTSIPRYVVSHCLGAEALGAFAVAGGLSVAAALLVGATSQAAGPRLAHYYARGDTDAFRRLLQRLLALVAGSGAVILLGMVLFGRTILGTLYGSQFAQYANLAVFLMAAGTMKDVSVLLGRAISSMRRFRVNLAVRLAGVLVLLVLLNVLVPRFGLLGAAWAIALGWLLSALVSVAYVLRKLRLNGFPELPANVKPKSRRKE